MHPALEQATLGKGPDESYNIDTNFTVGRRTLERASRPCYSPCAARFPAPRYDAFSTLRPIDNRPQVNNLPHSTRGAMLWVDVALRSAPADVCSFPSSLPVQLE